MEPAFVILNPDDAEKRIRRLAGSVSSKYLNYNASDTTALTMRRNDSQPDIIRSSSRLSLGQKSIPSFLGGASALNSSSLMANNPNSNRISNYNEYVHIMKDRDSANEPNMSWIVHLRNYPQEALRDEPMLVDEDKPAKAQQTKDVQPPSVYYKGLNHRSKGRISDFEYRGNYLDIVHLSEKRLGPTPHLS